MEQITCALCAETKDVTNQNFYYHKSGKFAGQLMTKRYCKPCWSMICNRNNNARRNEILDHYGAVCACCGTTERLFLHIDHVNGNGAQHRKKVGGGLAAYRDIIRQGFPDWIQILCSNCNRAKGQLTGRTCPAHHPEDHPAYFARLKGIADLLETIVPDDELISDEA